MAASSFRPPNSKLLHERLNPGGLGHCSYIFYLMFGGALLGSTNGTPNKTSSLICWPGGKRASCYEAIDVGEIFSRRALQGQTDSTSGRILLTRPSGGQFLQFGAMASRFEYTSEAAAKGGPLQRWARQERDFPEPQWNTFAAKGATAVVSANAAALPGEKQLVMPRKFRTVDVRGSASLGLPLEAPGHGDIYRHVAGSLAPTSGFNRILELCHSQGDLERFHLLLNLSDIRDRRAEVNRLSKESHGGSTPFSVYGWSRKS